MAQRRPGFFCNFFRRILFLVLPFGHLLYFVRANFDAVGALQKPKVSLQNKAFLKMTAKLLTLTTVLVNIRDV